MEYFTRVIFEQSFKLQNQIDRCWHSFILIIGITSIVLTIKPISSSAKPVNGLSNSHTKSIYFFQKTVKGKVTDSLTGQSLTGVTIKVKDENIGTVTDAKGNFSLEVPDNAVLEVSYLGYKSKEVSVEGETNLHISLASTATGLNQLVVVGYGTQSKKDLSSSISVIDPKEIQKNAVLPNAGLALEGTAPGVSVTPSSGAPGAGINIRIRGSNSFGNNSPLVIIDGSPGDLNNVNPSDIESMQVLKDAAAAAIYGSRAANGVVIVQTKNGTPGEVNINVKSYYGFQQLTHFIPMANLRQYAKIDNKLHKSAGLPVFEALKDPETLGLGTDWQRTVYQTAPLWNAYMSISGGSENSTYRVSGSYNRQEGVARSTWNRKANIHFNGRQKTGNFTFSESISWISENERALPGGGDKDLTQQIILGQPMIPVYDSANIGGFGGAPSYLATQSYNPLGLLELQKIENKNSSIYIDLQGEYKFFDHFTYRLNFGYSVVDAFNHTYTPQYFFSNQRQNIRASLTETRSRTIHWLLENTVDYKQQFGKHNLSLLAGFTTEEDQIEQTIGSKSGFPNNSLEVLDASTGFSIDAGGNKNQWDLVSFLGRLQYNYDYKYFLTANVRRDGSSRFGQSNRYGTFPSVSVAWGISQEHFFSPIKSTISNLKIRASYGVLGNEPSVNYAYLPSLTYSAGLGYLFGGGFESGAAKENFVNPDVKWETTKDLDFGVDFEFKHSISLTLDYYVDRTSNLLLNVPIPPSTGTITAPLVNTGVVQNKGFEASITYKSPSKKTFHYSISGNLSTVKNKVIELGFADQIIYGEAPYRASTGPITEAIRGYPIGAFFMMQADGIFQNQKEIDNYSHNGTLIQPNAKPGDIRYVDVNKDGKIDAQDVKYSGSPFPKISYGVSFSANYKNFDFSLFVQGTAGNKMFDTNTWITNQANSDYNFNKDLLDAWTPENTQTNIPRLTFNDPNNNRIPSTRFLYSASFLRFKTIQLGYSFPRHFLNNAGISKLRVFINAYNLWTITKYPGYDPSYTNDGLINRGLDQGLYPIPRIVSAGVDIDF